MKLSLLFVFLAVYAVHGQEGEQATGSSQTPTIPKFSFGGFLSKLNSSLHLGLGNTEDIVLSGLGLGNKVVQAGTDLASQGISKGTSLASSGVDIGADLASQGIQAASGITNQTLALIQKLPGSKIIPTTAIGSIANKVLNLANKGVNLGKNGINKGIKLGNNVGQGVTAGINIGSQVVTDTLSKLESAKISFIGKIVSGATSGVSNGLDRIGKGIQKTGEAISTSAVITE